MKTNDGHELKKGHYYYLENGQCVILEEFATSPDGRDLFLVVPFYEGEVMDVSGDGGYHHEITVKYEHEGQSVLVESIFMTAPTEKLCSIYSTKLKEIEMLSLAIGEIRKTIQELKNTKAKTLIATKQATNDIASVNRTMDRILIERQKLEDQVNAARKQLSKYEDAIATLKSNETTTVISVAELQELRKRDFKLTCLENGGVDNWEWYDESLSEYFKRYP
jgi:hypothetical protein